MTQTCIVHVDIRAEPPWSDPAIQPSPSNPVKPASILRQTVLETLQTFIAHHSMPGNASPSAAALPNSGALREFQQRRFENNNARQPHAAATLPQRSNSSRFTFDRSSSDIEPHGLATSEQLPRWYTLFRHAIQDFWRVISLVYRLANHAFGSLFEVRISSIASFPPVTSSLRTACKGRPVLDASSVGFISISEFD